MGALLAEVRQRWSDPTAIVCDRWREVELRQVLEAVSFPSSALIVRGMGYMAGGADVHEFRKAFIDERVQPRRSLLLRAARAGARGVGMMRPQLRFWPLPRAVGVDALLQIRPDLRKGIVRIGGRGLRLAVLEATHVAAWDACTPFCPRSGAVPFCFGSAEFDRTGAVLSDSFGVSGPRRPCVSASCGDVGGFQQASRGSVSPILMVRTRR